jgi:hypothetical protein
MGMKEETAYVEILPAASRTADTNSSGVDMWAYGRAQSLKAIVTCGAVSGTSPTLDVKLQHAHNDVGNEYVDIPGATAAQLTGAGAREIAPLNHTTN